MKPALFFAAALTLALTGAALAQTPNCSNCAVWNTPQQPFRIYGNTYYVGVHGLSAILVTSGSGHILIDGDLAESAPLIPPTSAPSASNWKTSN